MENDLHAFNSTDIDTQLPQNIFTSVFVSPTLNTKPFTCHSSTTIKTTIPAGGCLPAINIPKATTTAERIITIMVKRRIICFGTKCDAEFFSLFCVNGVLNPPHSEKAAPFSFNGMVVTRQTQNRFCCLTALPPHPLEEVVTRPELVTIIQQPQ